MALNLRKKLKIAAAAVGFSALPLTGCSDAAAKEQAASDVKTTAPSTVQKQETERNLYYGVPKTAVIIYGSEINTFELEILQELLKEKADIDLYLYAYDRNIDKDLMLPPEKMQIYVSGFDLGQHSRSVFGRGIGATIDKVSDKFQERYDALQREKVVAKQNELTLVRD